MSKANPIPPLERIAVGFEDAADLLTINESTLRQNYRQMGVPFRKVGGLVRFSVDELRDFMAGRVAA